MVSNPWDSTVNTHVTFWYGRRLDGDLWKEGILYFDWISTIDFHKISCRTVKTDVYDQNGYQDLTK